LIFKCCGHHVLVTVIYELSLFPQGSRGNPWEYLKPTWPTHLLRIQYFISHDAYVEFHVEVSKFQKKGGENRKGKKKRKQKKKKKKNKKNAVMLKNYHVVLHANRGYLAFDMNVEKLDELLIVLENRFHAFYAGIA
jgi:hypothetical protein